MPDTPSLRYAAWVCVLTVFGDTYMTLAISRSDSVPHGPDYFSAE